MACAENSSAVLTPEAYDGSELFDLYEEQFTCCAALARWSDCEKAQALGAVLRGQARTHYFSLDSSIKLSYVDLVRALKLRFGTQAKHQQHWIYKFHNRQREKGESVAVFADELALLVRQAYPDCIPQEMLALQ